MQSDKEMENTNEAEKIKSQCYAVIDRFQHRAALQDDNIRYWVANVVKDHGEAAVWHATRAGGFGGSDIGVLVRNYNGHRADHMNSAHDIVASKLLKTLPSEDTGDLRRGHENEPAHAKRFYTKYSADRDVGAFEKLSSAVGLRPWMRYSPDDVVLIPSKNPNPSLGGAYFRRFLIDYKAPRRVEEDDSIAFQYACQLHQGAMICAKAGVHLDGLMLSQFDWANWELKDDNLPYDSDLAKMILQAGDHYHQFVMKGELPPYIMTPRFEREAEFVDAFGKKAQRLAHLMAAAKAFEDEAKLLGDELRNSFKDVRLAGKKMQLGDLSVTAVAMVDHEKVNQLLSKEEVKANRKKGVKPDYNTESMAAKLKSLGGDPEDYRIDKVDAEKVYDFMVEKGLDPEQFMTEQIRTKVADHLKEAAKELVLISFPRDGEEVVEEIDAADAAQTDVREGQITERHSQRTAMA